MADKNASIEYNIFSYCTHFYVFVRYECYLNAQNPVSINLILNFM